MSEPGLTKRSHKLLGDFLDLESEEQIWFMRSALEGMSDEFRELISPSNQERRMSGKTTRSMYERARDLLLDDLKLKSSEKVLLAAFCICDLYELHHFSSRQVTEALHETGNSVSNVTSVLTGLYQKGLMKYQKDGDTQQAQKRYSFSPDGIQFTRRLLESRSEHEVIERESKRDMSWSPSRR